MGEMLPKRRAGRPRLPESEKKRKVGVVTTKAKKEMNYYRLDDIRLNVPALPLVWRVRKMTWLIRNIEKHLQEDPTFISPKDYYSLLKDMETAYNELELKGLGTNAKRTTARKGIRSKRLDQDGESVRSSRVGEDESAGVDSGVSATNPFGR